MIQQGTLRHAVVAALFVALVTTVLAVHLAARARGVEASRCERFSAQSVVRSQVVTGSGDRVVVIGDSYAAGLGLGAPVDSWPARLAGAVHVAGFSGSGFSRSASACGRVSFADRAGEALAGGAALVVVQGGLNDHDQPSAEIRAGFERLVAAVDGLPTVVVGPPRAPARAGDVRRVDRLLAGLARVHGLGYVSSLDLDLAYLGDDLHLTPAGHRTFGDAVARALTP